jgi:SAM-dependent methyltransferase
VRGYRDDSYGDGFADIYDTWYADVTDVAATVEMVHELAGARGRVLELGVGTGRIALPMADAGLRVTGIDVSDAMLARLSAADPARRVETVRGDMVDDLPTGPFDVAIATYNTIFNLLDEQRQRACFHAVAQQLSPAGAFVVEAFIPDTLVHPESAVGVREMTVDQVVLSITRNHSAAQRIDGQFIELSEAGGVRLRPWSIRWASPSQLDAMAVTAGFTLEARWADMTGAPFDADGTDHVSVYRRS